MGKDNSHTFAAYYKRAVSPLIVLSLLKEKPMYGYEISSEMNKRSNKKLGIAVLYPVLYRLEEQGFIYVEKTLIENGRTREYYAITKEGETYLEKSLAEYKELSMFFEKIVDIKGENGNE